MSKRQPMDQAESLRALARAKNTDQVSLSSAGRGQGAGAGTSAAAAKAPGNRPAAARLLFITGGRPDAGISAVAYNVADVLARGGGRVVLCDGDASGMGREQLRHQSSGLAVAVGWRDATAAELLDRYGSSYDTLVVAHACALTSARTALAVASDECILVLNGDVPSFLNCYALIKLACQAGRTAPVAVVVNGCGSEAAGEALYERFAAVVARFLPLPVTLAAVVPQDASLAESRRQARPVYDFQPGSVATSALARLAAKLRRQEDSAQRGAPPARAAAGRKQRVESRA